MMKVLEEGLNVCLSCGEGLDGALIDFQAERNETDPECDYCAGEGESKKPETYLVTFEITSETDPAEWDWNELLDLGVRESSYVHYIGQITRNNQREGK
jgi:hypothetical protein